MKTDYLRISVTDRCNLKCVYCHPFGAKDFIPHDEIMRFEEIVELIKILNPLGIRKVRVTGGEPLIKRGIETLIAMLKDFPGIEEINMTTNGVLLGEKYDTLVRSGIDRINISLNTLKRERYKELMGVDCLPSVLDTIARISEEGRTLLKINTILFKGINDDEIVDLVDFAVRQDICIRFIEYYSTNNAMRGLEKRIVTVAETKDIIEKRFGRLEPYSRFPDNGPAQTFSIRGNKGAVGFISSHTENFCERCTRLRLSSDGKIFPCLFSRDFLDVKRLLRENMPADYIKEELSGLISSKCNYSKKYNKECNFSLRSIGG